MIWSQSPETGSNTAGQPAGAASPCIWGDQKLAQLNDGDSPMDALKPFAPLIDEQRKMALISAGFPYLPIRRLSALSGGEQARLLLSV